MDADRPSLGFHNEVICNPVFGEVCLAFLIHVELLSSSRIDYYEIHLVAQESLFFFFSSSFAYSSH